MLPLRRVGMDTAQLTDEEVQYIDGRVVEAVRPLLVGRGYSLSLLCPMQGS